LFNVTDCGALVVPTLCAENVILLREIVATVPVPVMRTFCGLAPPSSEKLRVALSGPISAGWNLIVTMQVELPDKLLPHVFEAMTKSVALVPVTVIPLKFNAVVPWLVTVNVCPALAVPTSCGEKLRAEADTETAVPVPVRLTL
jgi:hypothetical protein